MSPAKNFIHWHRFLLAILAMVVFFGLHAWGQWQLVSITPWVLLVPTFLAFTYRNSLVLLFGVLLAAEAFSMMPPGVMSAVVIVPYLLSRWLTSGVRLWSPRLWISVLLICGLQLMISLGGYFWQQDLLSNMAVDRLWLAVPWLRLALQWIASTIVVSFFIGLWYEFTPGTVGSVMAK